jgi:hypothetical protein
MIRWLVISASVLACSSGTTTLPKSTPPTGDRVTEEEDGKCPSPSSVLYGTVATGGACMQGSDCAPVCCPCSNGSNHEWLAVHCSSGTCVGAPQVCTDTASDADLCPIAP